MFSLEQLDYDAAEADLRRCLELDPLWPWTRWVHASLGSIELAKGDLAKAKEHYRRSTTS